MQEILAAPLLAGAVPQVPQDTNIGRWVVLGVWLAGTAVVFFWWGRQWRPLRSALRSATPLLLGPDCDTGGLTVMSSPSAFEPGVVGILRPVLLFPEGLVDRLTRAQLDAILAHERAHVRAHDNLLAVVHMAVEAIFWFHPLVWWIERRMIDERERACDEAVVRAGKQPADYAEGILAVCRWSLESPVMCVSGVTGSDLRTRIEAILANRLGRRLHLTGRVLLAGAALIVIGGPIGIGLLDAAAKEQPAAQGQATERFEVATIRPNTGPAVGGPIGGGLGFRPGRFSAENITLQQLLTSAYELQAYEIFGGPDWVTSDRFDIAATMPPSPTGLDDLNARCSQSPADTSAPCRPLQARRARGTPRDAGVLAGHGETRSQVGRNGCVRSKGSAGNRASWGHRRMQRLECRPRIPARARNGAWPSPGWDDSRRRARRCQT